MKATILAAVAVTWAGPSVAEVTKSDPGGFVSTHRLTIAAPPEKVWDTIAKPSVWWSKDHTYSGDSANISWDTRPGGCWCETVEGGAVEHGRTMRCAARRYGFRAHSARFRAARSMQR